MNPAAFPWDARRSAVECVAAPLIAAAKEQERDDGDPQVAAANYAMGCVAVLDACRGVDDDALRSVKPKLLEYLARMDLLMSVLEEAEAEAPPEASGDA